MKIVFGLLSIVAALAVATTTSAAGPPIIGTPLGVGKMATPYSLKTKAGSMIVEQITVKPGGDFGWHSHGASVAVVITQGTLTVYDKTIANCRPFHVTKGMSFVEPANHIHRARNEGTQTVKLYAVYLGVPKGVQVNKPAQAPAGCSS
jgi:mannose-6-phosphate isomerase-like protein (cupin superfamily)